mmetsp:Transcript_49466/g.59606  ORF Transcript_49466/g.59606 Transcript_49466/m.59606 type:complete len:212 (-) Transcript_49466:66-701(-)|eukprot:CAMPEP_0194379302 /NCGR_PEP_ID=MMETSP0174-20130528/39114_1 /TAXON_ID=216777 /ORGANISM="Proboscia alata, Strain PI-D3" /LENGTH=211 /DNA_ID=CAMNT_0039161937 /DNA_START=69 /DNA_END=704 /DNA_ORIENTATION=+
MKISQILLLLVGEVGARASSVPFVIDSIPRGGGLFNGKRNAEIDPTNFPKLNAQDEKLLQTFLSQSCSTNNDEVRTEGSKVYISSCIRELTEEKFATDIENFNTVSLEDEDEDGLEEKVRYITPISKKEPSRYFFRVCDDDISMLIELENPTEVIAQDKEFFPDGGVRMIQIPNKIFGKGKREYNLVRFYKRNDRDGLLLNALRRMKLFSD